MASVDRSDRPPTGVTERIEAWRRFYAAQPPNEESLRDTVARVVPFHLRHIQPEAMRGPMLIVAHGNSLRALVTALEGLGPDEIATGSIRVYRFAPDTTLAFRTLVA